MEEYPSVLSLIRAQKVKFYNKPVNNHTKLVIMLNVSELQRLADAQFKAAVENRQAAMTDLVSEMKARNIRTLKFKGDNLQYQPGHITPEKIKFVPSST